MAPTDPRFHAMTDEEIIVEYEAYLHFKGETLKTCPRCKVATYRSKCPFCPDMSLTGDALADDLFARLEAGEDVDLNLLDAGKRATSAAKFVTITPEEFEPIEFYKQEEINHGDR